MEDKVLSVEQIDSHIEKFEAEKAKGPSLSPEAAASITQLVDVVTKAGVDVCTIINKVRPVLPFVAKYLLFWKPKWQGAVNDLLTLLDIFCPPTA